MKIKFNDIVKTHRKISTEIKWTETSYSQLLSDKTAFGLKLQAFVSIHP